MFRTLILFVGVSSMTVVASVFAAPLPYVQFHVVEPPVCRSCEVVIDLVVRLRQPEGEERPVVGRTGIVIRDDRGRVFLVHTRDPSTIHVFENDGRYLETLGGQGTETGGFISAGPLMFDGFGNLYVFDRFQERVTSFSPQLELLETRSVPQRFRPRRALTLGPGNGVLVAASAYTEDLIGYPLHLLSDAFELVRSFGLTDADDQVVRPDMISLQLRNVAKAGVNLVWAAPYNEYSVQQWDVSTGARRLTIERTPDWFPSWYAAEGLSLGKPPQPIFRGIRQDHQGLLWTLVGVASEDWRSGIHTRDDGELELTARDAYRDTIIEIIDPSTFELLVSERLDEDITGFTNDGLMISNVGSNANPSVELLRAELHR